MKDWYPGEIIREIRGNLLEEVGDSKGVFNFSGGVDSTTGAAIASVLGDRLLCPTIDAGNLRYQEPEEILLHAQLARVQHHMIQASHVFVPAISATTDAEEKRRIFKHHYVETTKAVARQFGDNPVIIQGTLAPDMIESGATGGALIKSHHNVGIDWSPFRDLHPFGHLFKYEIRALARELGLPESVSEREPFPGPGLFLRCVGIPATLENLNVVRWADYITRNIVKKHGIAVSQMVTAFMGVRTVGVRGDGRAYGNAMVIRAVETVDYMTARGIIFPENVQREINPALIAHPQIVRVWYDSLDKPPGTIEFE